jgi:hypothetical protein
MSKSATEVKCQADLKLHQIRDVTCSFLARTKALNLERDLVYFLLEIDKQHEEQIKALTLRVELLSAAISNQN